MKSENCDSSVKYMKLDAKEAPVAPLMKIKTKPHRFDRLRTSYSYYLLSKIKYTNIGQFSIVGSWPTRLNKVYSTE